MGARGYNAGGFAWMDWVTCPICGARRPLGRVAMENPKNHVCPDRDKCAKRRESGKYLNRIK